MTLRCPCTWLAVFAALAVNSLACAPAAKGPASAKPASRAAGPVRLGGVPLLGEDPDTSVLVVEAGVTGDRISGLLQVPADECAVVIARASTSVEDLDLLAYGDDGSSVGTDEGPDRTPALLICPPHPTRVWVTARIAAGHGLVAVGSQRVAQARASSVAARFGVRDGAESPTSGAQAFPGLDERLAAHRREIGGDWQNLRRVALPLDSRLPSRFSAPIEPDSCVEAWVLPPAETAYLELVAYDSEGAVLGRGVNVGRERFVVLCSPLETNVSFEVRPQSGKGVGVLVLSRTRPLASQALDVESHRIDAFAEQEADAEAREADARLAPLYKGVVGKRSAVGLLEVGRRTSLTLRLAPGCSRLDVVAGAPLRGLEAWAYSANDQLVSHDRAGKQATLFVCGRGGALRLDLEAALRPGPAQLLLRTEDELPAVLLDRPLAAGRLLGDMTSRGVLRRASEIGQVTEFQLSETRLSTLDVTIPLGRCVDVALGLDADLAGAEIRLISLKTGQEIARGRGTRSASARACSLSASSVDDNLRTRVELRAEVGSGAALVATRMLSPAR